MRFLGLVLLAVLWISYTGLLGNQIWITVAEINNLNPKVPLDQVKKLALTNRVLLYSILLVFWIGSAIIYGLRSSSRLKENEIVRRMGSGRRWKWALLNPPPVTFLGVMAFIGLHPKLGWDPIWPVPIVVYVLGVFLRVVSGEKPDPESPKR